MLGHSHINPDTNARCTAISLPLYVRCADISTISISEVDPFSGRHSLDFEGRALCASVKNFQLESREEPGRATFLFGKHAKDEYCMDYSYPMSPLQAFALALSALGYKLGNEGG
jgi:hypothetical protein